jgi:hypothetical protein
VKVVLLGVAPPNLNVPGANGGPAFLETQSGRRLARILGLPSVEWMVEHYVCLNVFDQPVDAINPRAARDSATAKIRLHDPDVVLCCGVTPRNALGLDAWMKLQYLPDGTIVGAIPHPSGKTRFWNDPKNVDLARSFFSRLVAEAD